MVSEISVVESAASGLEKTDSADNKKIRASRLKPEQLSDLVDLYRKSFDDYCKGRSKKPNQLIPSKVWSKMQADIEKQLNRSMAESEIRQYQDALRGTLKEISTGVSNDEFSEKPAIQDISVVQMVRKTDTYAKRCVLQKRDEILLGEGVDLDDNKTESDIESPTETKKVTKAEHRIRCTEAFESLATSIKDNSKHESAFFNSQTNLTTLLIEEQKEKKDRMNSKRKLEDLAIEEKKKRNVQLELQNLLWLKNNNVISQEEFMEKCKNASGL